MERVDAEGQSWVQRHGAALSRALMASVSAEAVVVDESGVIVAANARWTQFSIDNSCIPCSPAPGTGVGDNYLAACQAEVAIPAREGILAVMEGRAPRFELEYDCHSPTQERWFAMVVTPMVPRELGVVIIHTSTSDRVQAERAREARQQQLETLVHERTAELERAKEGAEAAHRANRVFLANMSHELRAPLTAILGLNYLMVRDGGNSREQQERLARIENAGKHLMSIINDILDISKIEAGRIELEETDFNLDILLDNVVSLISEAARDKRLTLTVERGEVPIWLHGDATRLSQALLNYAGNAIKFTETGSITLRTSLMATRDDELFIRFEVIDTGIGIEPEMLNRLFRMFEQADATAVRNFGGTGLGLAITRGLAQLMGGAADVDSTPGMGSTFWFTARLHRAHGPEIARLVQALRPPGDVELQLRLRHGGARVLLVDDHPASRDLITEFLQGVGLSVHSVSDGHAAIARASQMAYDLVLMDMQMPGLDGLAATRAIRELPGWSKKPILAITAHAFDDARHASEEVGMNDFLTKAASPAALYAALLSWLPPAMPGLAGERRWRPPPVAPPQAAIPARGVTRDDSLERLAQLPGLNAQRVVASLQGNADKYVQLLHFFVEYHAQELAGLDAPLAAGGVSAVYKFVHALKGAAAMLGAEQLAEEATRLAEALQQDSKPSVTEIRFRLDSIEQHLTEIAGAIRGSQPAARQADVGVDAEVEVEAVALPDSLPAGRPNGGPNVEELTRLPTNDGVLEGLLANLEIARTAGNATGVALLSAEIALMRAVIAPGVSYIAPLIERMTLAARRQAIISLRACAAGRAL